MKKVSKILTIVMAFALLATSMMISTVSVQAAEKVVLDWDFKTVDGNYVKDNSGNGNDGYIGDGVTVENGVATFEGTDNEGIELPDEIFEGAEVVTIEFTMSPSEFSNYTALLCVGDTNGEWVVIGVMGDGSVRYAVATNGDDNSESKGNSTSGGEGNSDFATFHSEETLMAGAEYAVKYVIEEGETNVYIDGELALTVDTEDKDLISDLGGPVILGKATKWPDPSYRGTISGLKITLEGDFAESEPTEEPETPTEEPAAPTEEATATPEATVEATETPAPTTAKPSATKAPVVTNAPTTTPVNDASTDGGFPIWIIAVVAAVVVAVVVVVIIVAKKKKA